MIQRTKFRTVIKRTKFGTEIERTKIGMVIKRTKFGIVIKRTKIRTMIQKFFDQRTKFKTENQIWDSDSKKEGRDGAGDSILNNAWGD